MKSYPTFEELAYEMIIKPNEELKEAQFAMCHPEYNEALDSVTLMESCLEMAESYGESCHCEIEYECAEAMAFEGERWEQFKRSAKEIFGKIIEAIKKVVKLIISIITWPFRMIAKLLFRKKNKSVERVIGLRNNNIKIETPIYNIASSIKNTSEQSNVFLQKAPENLKGITSYIKDCIELADQFARDKYNISLNKFYKDINKNLKSKLAEIQERRSIMNNALQVDMNAIKTCKNDEIFTSLSKIQNILHCQKHSNQIKQIESTLKEVEYQLNKLANKIASINEDFNQPVYNKNHEEDNNDSQNYRTLAGTRDVIHESLSLIRTYVTDFARINIDISKYFRNIDKEIQRIDEIAGYVIDSYTDENVKETIGGVKVVVDDIYVAHDKNLHRKLFQLGGAAFLDKQRHRVNSMVFKYGNKEISTRYDKSDFATITISEGVYKLKTDPEPGQEKWYEAIVGHEYGHRYINKNDEKIKNSGHLDQNYISNEIISDKIGKNISGLTKEEYAKLHEWFGTVEMPRLIKVYSAYLEERGISDPHFDPNENEADDSQRFQSGVRYKYM
ncbi:MAG: hypothetical protein FWC09_08355 [Lachnospiraceae bacterium]|nr:hypothetical protein [Lachnospiraceae bacterium]